MLTPLLCQIWYLGDGCLRNLRNNTQDIVLCTNCFDKGELERIILPQLDMFDARLYKTANLSNGREAYTIRIGKKDNVINFLKYIGDCPFEDYQHKWDVKPSLLSGT